MATYQTISLGSNISTIATSIDAQNEAMRSFERGTVEPTVKPVGLFWNRTDYAVLGDAIVRWNGSAWVLVLDPEFAALNAGGSVALGANLPAGGNKLTGLGAGSGAGDSVRYEQVMLLSGVNAMAADLDMGGNQITGLGAPSASTDAATKAYVDAGAFTGKTAAGSVSTTGATWEAVNLGFTFDALYLTIHSSGANFSSDTEVQYAPASRIVLQSDGTGTLTWKFAEGAIAGNNFHELEIRRTTSPAGFEIRETGTNTATVVVRYLAVKNG